MKTPVKPPTLGLAAFRKTSEWVSSAGTTRGPTSAFSKGELTQWSPELPPLLPPLLLLLLPPLMLPPLLLPWGSGRDESEV